MALIPTRDDAILFCLNPEIEPLNIIADEKVRVNHLKINDIIQNYNVIKIEPWLPNARNHEHDGEIYLNRIYRIIINGDRSTLKILKNDLEQLSDIHSSEYECQTIVLSHFLIFLM